MGLLVSTPPSERTVADLMLPSVVGTEAATPCSQKEPDEPIYKACFPAPGGVTSVSPASSHSTSRRRDLGGQMRSVLPETLSWCYAAVASLLQRNSVPSTHMRYSTAASMRARATFARFMPRRLATSSAQRLSEDIRTTRVSMDCAAS